MTTFLCLEIDEIEVERETESSVWIGRSITPERKRSNYRCFFDTWEDAKNYLIEKKALSLEDKERQLEQIKEDIKVAKDKLKETKELREKS